MREENDALIDAYLKGRLDEEGRRSVERLVAEDASFREEIRFRQQATKAFARNEYKRLKSRLQQLSMEAEPSTTPIFRDGSRRRWWYAAASITLIGVISLVFWMQQPARTATELYSAYFDPYPNIAAPIVREASESHPSIAAYACYEQGDYRRAYELFGELIKRGEADADASFYQALSAMSLNQDQEALVLLSAYMDSANPKLMRQAQWYSALARMKVGETQEAVALLEQLSASKGYKQNEAKVLIRELKP